MDGAASAAANTVKTEDCAETPRKLLQGDYSQCIDVTFHGQCTYLATTTIEYERPRDGKSWGRRVKVDPVNDRSRSLSSLLLMHFHESVGTRAVEACALRTADEQGSTLDGPNTLTEGLTAAVGA